MVKDSIEIMNYVPRFLEFYHKAVGHDEETRFELWKKHYGFAAVPPGEEGALLARKQLEAAWDRYEAVVPALEQWMPDSEKIQQYLWEIKTALKYEEPVDVALLFFVGTFDGNAFAAPYGENRMVVCLPVEEGEKPITMVHELIHIVHGKINGSTMNWERPVAALVMEEGLATQLSKHLVSGYTDEEYLGSQNGWLQDCGKDKEQILQGIKPYLRECSGERIFQFTMGQGTTGKMREGYFAGWKLVGDMVAKGCSFADIARIREADMADVLTNHMNMIQ